jgi:hypothetical protein
MHALLAELESVALNELKREWNGNGDKWATKVFFVSWRFCIAQQKLVLIGFTT